LKIKSRIYGIEKELKTTKEGFRDMEDRVRKSSGFRKRRESRKKRQCPKYAG
jgi:hypothetical protein